MEQTITERELLSFEAHLREQEKSDATVEKYVRDLRAFAAWLDVRSLDKSAVLAYKKRITEDHAPVSVNACLSSLHAFFSFLKREDLRVRKMKVQHALFSPEERELTRHEYEALLQAATKQGKQRLSLILRTLCSTGIRVSELHYITVSAVRRGHTDINNKGKIRRILLPRVLCKMLTDYLKKQGRTEGQVFVTKTGKAIDRSNLWAEMKHLCRAAGVSPQKVIPHNLRHLFARTFYAVEKDVVRLADVLGHANINTTRIYTRECGAVHRRILESLPFLRC